MNSWRFTLRKEYFGGLIYDSKTTNIELLTHSEYRFFHSITLKEKGLKNHCSEKRIEEFLKNGFISLKGEHEYSTLSMRLVKPPKNIRKGVLTAPIRVFDSYTRQCNFQCVHCYFTSSAFIKESRRTIKQTKDIIKKFYKAGTMEWRFTGGEALIHADVFEAIKYAKSLGMNVGIYSNGSWSDNTAQKILASGINEVVLSLEGSPEVNDKRRKKGGYKITLGAIKRIHNFNKSNPHKAIQGVIATAVARDNLQDLPFLAHLAAQYGFNINFMPLKPSGRARYALSKEMLDSKEYMRFAKSVQKIRNDPYIVKSGIKVILKYKDLFNKSCIDKSDRPFPFNYAECGALTNYISMMPDGQVFSCPFVLDVDSTGKYLGPNMINTSIEKAWNNSHFDAYRVAKKIGCLECRFYMKQCRGKCRATVLGFGGKIAHGKLIGDDPQCFASLM